MNVFVMTCFYVGLVEKPQFSHLVSDIICICAA